MKSLLNIRTILQEGDNKQDNGGDNKPEIRSANGLGVTSVHNDILKLFGGSFKDTQSINERDQCKGYGKYNALQNPECYGRAICKQVGNTINWQRYVENPKGHIDSLFPDRLDIKKSKYGSDIDGKDKHEHKAKKIEMHKRAKDAPRDFIGIMFIEIYDHAKIYKCGDEKPDNASLEKFIEDAWLFFAGKDGSQNNKCKEANRNDLQDRREENQESKAAKRRWLQYSS